MENEIRDSVTAENVFEAALLEKVRERFAEATDTFCAPSFVEVFGGEDDEVIGRIDYETWDQICEEVDDELEGN